MEELFTNKIFTYPLISKSSYLESLENIFKEFENLIDSLNKQDSNFDAIKEEKRQVSLLNKNIIKCIEAQLMGKPHNSTLIFRELIESEFVAPKIISSSEIIDFTNPNKKINLFRIRSTNENLRNRDEMFHIPLSERHKVANQRFSIEGLPSLYLGSSIYVCWLELNRPSLSSIFVSGFKPINTFKIFDLSYNLKDIYSDYKNKKITIEAFKDKFLILPLIFACSFQIKHPNSPFKEEYIFPKLVLEWITYKSDDLVGLKYQSTKVSDNTRNNSWYFNYVFPPKKMEKNRNFCIDLVNNFELTNPIPWELLQILPEEILNVGSVVNGKENIEEVLSNSYNETKFGSAEMNIFDMKFKKVENT